MFTKFVTSRFFHFVILPLLIVAWFLYTDPSKGADTLMRIQLWAQVFLMTGLSYTVTKAMLGKASSEAAYDAAMTGNAAAGQAYLGMCLLRGLVFAGVLLFFAMLTR